MSEETPFQHILRRVRAGEADAAAELVRTYGAHIRRVARLRMRDPDLRRSFDSSDICQSVFASFLARLALGQFEVEQPGQLVRLLESMARNKVATAARRTVLARRAARARPVQVMDSVTEPTHLVAGDDLVKAFRARMTEDERWLSDQRVQGRSWAEIAAETGATPEALRKRLVRALDRVAALLGLGDA